jgi:hypothetical protein
MIGAKKFTRRTWSQTSTVVSIEDNRLPPSALGEIAALLTSAMQFAVIEPLLDLGDGCERAAGIGQVDLDVILRPHFPRAVLRKRMASKMTRQPAAEKRFTVAWPMPRLAPVSSSARRGWFE